MKSLPLTALLMVLVAACNRPAKEPDTARTGVQPTAETGLVDAVYEVLDKDTRQRVGLVFKRRYGDDRVVYWVEDTERERRGYVLPNNQAYAYEWVAGKRTEQARFLGADTITSGVGGVRGHGRPVVLEETTLEALAEEVRSGAGGQKQE